MTTFPADRMPSELGSRFLVEALDLVASYLHGPSVALDALHVGTARMLPGTDEQLLFRRELEARHALACALRLRPLVAAIERAPSATSAIVATQSKGDLVGRLDVPRYLAQRTFVPSTPRTYPVLVNQRKPETPENALVVSALRGLAQQLGRAPFPRTRAEGLECATLGAWARSRLRRSPWSEVTRSGAVSRLRGEAAARVRKRQTGSEAAYADLLRWTDEWLLDVGRFGSAGARQVVEGLLAFPPGDFFWDRVFEVWCLQEVSRALLRCGCAQELGPTQLSDTSSATYRFHWQQHAIDLWFQRQQPIGSPQWFYADTGRPLAGIPDIVATNGRSSPLVVDAKFRFTTGSTRPEETYKMLGYADNFRDQLENRLEGLLIFVGPAPLHRVLQSRSGGRLDLLSVESSPGPGSYARFRVPLDARILSWLKTLD